MNSDNSGRDSRLDEFARSISRSASSLNSDDVANGLRERMDELELRLEEFGRARKLQEELQDYVADLKQELGDLRRYRLIVTIVTTSVAVSFFVLIVGCMIVRPKWFVALDGALQVPLLVALIGGSVFLLTILLKGVYRTRTDRNTDDMLPEHIKAILQMLPKQ